MKNVPKDLSIIIPARNELFLAKTIENLIENIEGNTDIIAVLDGQWPEIPIPEHEKVTILYYPESIGQRACCNRAVEISDAKYIMKVDAHCSFAPGFDVAMMADMQDHWTFVPLMKNLHAFDWVCSNGHRRYQGPSGPCTTLLKNDKECGAPTTRDILWRAKPSPNSTAYRFDNTLHFQYWGAYKKRQVGDLPITMSIQGSCFMVTRDKWWALEICDEAHGSWGQQGVEVACKTWLSGGEVHVSKKTWYAHMFRTQGGDFGFPYPNPGISKARAYSRDLFLNDKWHLAIHPFSWLIEKFSPIPDWDTGSWGILYYTDNRPDAEILEKCQKQIKKTVGGHRIVSVSLEPTDFGDNIFLPLEWSYLTMFQQILVGLKELDTDYVFFCEHDVLYHPSHFLFKPSDNKIFYYNTNVWKVRMSDGHGLHYKCQQTSALCANREFLIEHYRNRIKKISEIGFSRAMGFEPGTHNRAERVDDFKAESWESEWPLIDLRHDKNLTESRWTKDEFRNKKFTQGWTEKDNIPGWGHLWHFWSKV